MKKLQSKFFLVVISCFVFYKKNSYFTRSWANFTLNTTDTTGTATNETKSDGQLILRYSGLNSTDSLSTLKSAVIRYTLQNSEQVIYYGYNNVIIFPQHILR